MVRQTEPGGVVHVQRTGATVHQQRDGRGLARVYGRLQRGVSVAVADVEVRPAVKQQGSGLSMARNHGETQWRLTPMFDTGVNIGTMVKQQGTEFCVAALRSNMQRRSGMDVPSIRISTVIQ